MESRRFEERGRGWADTAHTTEDNQCRKEGPQFRQQYLSQKYPTGNPDPVTATTGEPQGQGLAAKKRRNRKKDGTV